MTPLTRPFRVLAAAIRALAALAVLAAVVVGVPWLLSATLGIPWPRPLPAGINGIGPWLAIWRIDRARFVMDLLGIIGWAYWAAFIRQLAVQIPAAVADAILLARHAAPDLRARRTGPAASLVAVLLAALTISLAASRTPAAAKTSHSLPATSPTIASAPAIPATRAAVKAKSVELKQSETAHIVTRGDTLWDIAADHLGDPQRWHEIYDLNCRRVQDDGRTLTDPNLIQPGWTLTLPAAAATVHSAASAATAIPAMPTDEAPAPVLPILVLQPQPGPAEAMPARTAQASAPVAGTTTIAAKTGPSQDHDRDRTARPIPHRDRVAVELPDGGVVGIGLAAALAAALMLARKRVRTRAKARWPIPLDTPRPAIPAPVAALERAHLATLAPPGLGYVQDGDTDLDDTGDDPYLSGLSGLDVAEPAEPSAPAATAPPTASPRSGLTGPSIPLAYAAMSVTGTPSFGTDRGQEIPLNLRATTGLGLTGPGTLDTARAMLVAVLANGGPLPSLDHMRVLTPSTDLAFLLDGQVPAVPRLEITDNLEEAVDVLEAEYLERRRTLTNLALRDAAEVRRFYPDQTLEPVVLIATPEQASSPRLGALLEAGQTADLHAILIGPWPAGTTVHIDADGTAHCDEQRLDIQRAFTLSADETNTLLGELVPAPPADPETAPVTVVELAEPLAASGTCAAEAPDEPTPRLSIVPAQSAEVSVLPLRPRVSVNILGPFTITVDSREIPAPRPLVTSVLAFLALKSSGATSEQILEAVWTNPDGTNNGNPGALRATFTGARTHLRKATGEKKMYIDFGNNQYRLNPDEIATDIAEFHRLLDTANRVRDVAEQTAALEAAVDHYRDHLALGITTDWLIIDREAESRRFGDACCRLADLTLDDRPEFALHILERAVADADTNQELYAKIMRIQARLGRHGETWKTLRLLEVRLNALQDQPDQDLYNLAEQLTARQAG